MIDFCWGVAAADTDAKRPMRDSMWQADSQQDVRGLERSGGACRAGGDGDALEVEVEQH